MAFILILGILGMSMIENNGKKRFRRLARDPSAERRRKPCIAHWLVKAVASIRMVVARGRQRKLLAGQTDTQRK